MRNVELKVAPWCPFCKQNVDRPKPPDKRRLGEFPVGTCQCGAVYTSDPTGFNQGAAMIDALVHACNDNWDLAWDLLPDEDYLTDVLENYDEQTHQVVETRNLDGRLIRGVLFFVRLQRDLAGKAGDSGAKAKPAEQSLPPIEPEPDPKRIKKRADKSLVRELVAAEDYDSLVALCFDDKRTIRFLQRLLFIVDEEARWKTAHVIGVVCGRVSTRRPGMVSDLLHSLFNSCADSAAANWGAVETIGSIISARPDIFGAFVIHLLQFIADASMQVEVLWALGTVAEKRPDLIRKLPIYNLFGLLDSSDPKVKGHILRLLGRIRAREVMARIEAAMNDKTAIVLYEEGRPVQTTIAALAEEAMRLIGEQGEKDD